MIFRLLNITFRKVDFCTKKLKNSKHIVVRRQTLLMEKTAIIICNSIDDTYELPSVGRSRPSVVIFHLSHSLDCNTIFIFINIIIT